MLRLVSIFYPNLDKLLPLERRLDRSEGIWKLLIFGLNELYFSSVKIEDILFWGIFGLDFPKGLECVDANLSRASS